MTDRRAYENAVKRRKELQEELRRVDNFLELYSEFSGEEVGAPRFAPWDAKEGAAPTGRPKVFGGGFSKPANPPREAVGKMARKLMLEKGWPMARGEILDALRAAGTPIVGKDPSKNIGTIMWRLKDSFINIEGYGYWPKDAPLPDDIQKQRDIDELV